jgi:hypothetical protein
MFRAQKDELEARNQWAQELNRDLAERSARVAQLQDELAAEQNAARAVVEEYEKKVLALEEDVRQRTAWAMDTETRLSGELEEKSQELARCVEILHQTEQTLEERTVWGRQLEEQAKTLQDQMSMLRGSRWIKLGRMVGLGPALPGS